MSDQTTREVFISYHTNSAGETVKKLCAALEGAGITCWYAPRNVGANYAQSIVEAIRACRVFLLILNKESNLSAHVLNEVNCAFDRFRDHEDITLLPFRIDDCQLSDDVYYYLGRIHIMDGALPPEIQRVQELVDRISIILGKSAERTVTVTEAAAPGEAAPAETTYRLTGSMVYPDGHFVGREKELSDIHTALKGAEGKMFLVGMGGIGKSEIAKMYIKRHQADYDVILWVSFAGSLEQTLINDYAFPIRGLNRTGFPEDSDRDYFQRKLRVLKEIADRRVLLVVDNFDVTEDLDREDFCAGTYTVLFTTRYRQEGASLPEVDVTEMTDEGELLSLFQAEYTRSLDASALAHIRDIIRLLNGHTLSIRLVASAMQHRRIQPEKMAALLKSGAANMAKENVKAADMIFGHLREVFRLSTLSEEEQYLLKNLVLVPLSGMEVETFFDWCGADDFDVIDALIQKSWVVHNPATDEVHLHPLVAELMAGEVGQDTSVWEKYIERLCDECRDWASLPFELKQRYLSYSGTALEQIPKQSSLWRPLLLVHAQLVKGMSRYTESVRLYSLLLENTEDLAQRANLYGAIVSCLTLSAESSQEDCLELAQKGYSLLKDIPGEELTHEQGVEKVYLLHQLTEISRNLGHLDDAVAYARQALSLGAKFPRKSVQHSAGWSCHYLGFALLMQGKLEESRSVLEHGLELFAQIDDKLSASYCHDLLGQVLAREGRYEEALAENTGAMETIIHHYGEQAGDLAISLIRRGGIYRAMGDEENAKSCYSQAASIYHKLNFKKKEESVPFVTSPL